MASIRQWFGVEIDEVSWREKLVSIVGGALAIAVVTAISKNGLDNTGASMLIASMGASAVLLFAVPHGQLSQPWPVLAGHVSSAFIGITCARHIHDTELAAACAVGLAIGAMHQFRFIHPPGGATALSAVIGGPAVRSLGYDYLWQPVLLNTVSILVVAVAFNALFPWRRYPTMLAVRQQSGGAASGKTASTPDVSHEQILAALRSLDSFIDITEADLRSLVQILGRSST